MAISLARPAGIANVPLRLLALPLCKNPELIYYYAHKRKDGSRSSVKGKGKADNDQAPSIISDETQRAGENASNVVKGLETENTTMSEKIPQYISKATSESA